MNDTSVHNILSAISEAKLALDREPEYKAEIIVLKNDLSESQRHNQALEINGSNYRRAIDELQSKVRSLEVERDDASFRNMELEDKVAGYAKLVNDFTSNIESLRYDFQRDLEALEPKKVEPELLPSVKPVNIDPFGPDGGGLSQPLTGEGPSERPLPPSTTPSAPTTEAMPASVSSVQEPSSVSDTSTELPYNYKGRIYSAVFPSGGGCSIEHWVKNGGSSDDYWI